MRAITTVARTATSIVSLPLGVGAAVLASADAARRDPSATRLRARRREGWTVCEVVIAPHRTTVRIERDDIRDEIEGETLAYATYAARVAAAAGVPLRRVR
jgi:hypothetical protein